MQQFKPNITAPTKPLRTQRKRQYESLFVNFVPSWENHSKQTFVTFVPLPSFVGTSVGNNKLQRNNTMKRTPTKPLRTQRKNDKNPLCPLCLCGKQQITAEQYYEKNSHQATKSSKKRQYESPFVTFVPLWETTNYSGTTL